MRFMALGGLSAKACRGRSVAALATMLVVATPTIGCQARATDGPPVPFEDKGACPFKGCSYREWTVNAGVALKAERWIGAPVVFRLRKGERATATTGVVVTHRPGRVRFKRRVTLSTGSGVLQLQPSDTLYLLTYHGEGVTTAWHKGQVYVGLDGSAFFSAACARTPNACDGTIVERPISGWWVQVRNAKGQLGWTNQPERFDNQRMSVPPQ